MRRLRNGTLRQAISETPGQKRHRRLPGSLLPVPCRVPHICPPLADVGKAFLSTLAAARPHSANRVGRATQSNDDPNSSAGQVSGHGFSRADTTQKEPGFSPFVLEFTKLGTSVIHSDQPRHASFLGDQGVGPTYCRFRAKGVGCGTAWTGLKRVASGAGCLALTKLASEMM
jgi:hypothetical protein